MKKIYLATIAVGVGAMFFLILFAENNKKEPVTLTQSDSVEILTIDQKIERAELIVIGTVKTSLPTRWLAPQANASNNPSPEEVFQSGGLFTDTLITIDRTLKGDFAEPIVRVRSFIGETEQVRWANSSEPAFEKGQIYLLFLQKDIGPTKNVDPGDYVSVNSNTTVYKIVEDKAISADDEWVVEDLITYIQTSLSAESSSATSTDLPTETLVPIDIVSPTP